MLTLKYFLHQVELFQHRQIQVISSSTNVTWIIEFKCNKHTNIGSFFQGPALASAMSDAKLRRGAPLRSGFMASSELVHRVTTFLMKICEKMAYINIKNTSNYWGWFACTWYRNSIFFTWRGIDIAHVSPSYVHVYEHTAVLDVRQCTDTTRN